MKVKELIEILYSYNPNADIEGIFDYTGYPLMSIGFGGCDGCTKDNCYEVLFHFTNDSSEN